jgi:hypothetical protein
MPYSPTLSVFTAAFELILAVWIWRGGGERAIKRPLVLMLGLLAGYQLLEVLVCQSGGSPMLSRLAFADIVWLPPVGIWLIVRLAQPASPWPARVAKALLGLTGAWTLAVLTVPDFLTVTVCQAVFATYHTDLPLMYDLYGVFYDLGLMGLVFSGLAAAAFCEDAHRRRLIATFVAGNLAFILAALMTMVTVPATRGASPSILCHYALSLAAAMGWMGWRIRGLESERWSMSPTGAQPDS